MPAGKGSQPLSGRRVVVTRAREQAAQLVQMLSDSGATVLQLPVIEIAPPQSWDSLDRVIDGRYDLVVFTSVNGVRSYFERLFSKGEDARVLAGSLIAAVGETTSNELRSHGIIPDLVPDKFVSTGLFPMLDENQRGVSVAVVRAEEGLNDLIDELRRRGADVDLGVAYRTIPVENDLGELRSLIASGGIDVVTFTSVSTTDHFFGPLTETERGRLLSTARIASIGPTTTAAIKRYGRPPDVEAKVASVQSLHDAVVSLFEANHQRS